HHAMSCAPDKELCFVLFGHFQVYVALAEGFNSHTIEYYVETKNSDDRRLIAQATLGSDGIIDGRISNRDREQVLEHYLATIASVYDRLYEAIEQDQPVDLSHLTLAR
ncbi:transcriptional regulator, partial [Klebsiella variicola]|uniref:transcriptional regulator n=2 Tax=Klebsiella/Raoultella group TaxID=2890311 RepID=UPI000BA1535A